MEKTCLNCGTLFEGTKKARYCLKCRYKIQTQNMNQKKTKRKIHYITAMCPVCGEEVKVDINSINKADYDMGKTIWRYCNLHAGNRLVSNEETYAVSFG